MKQEDNRLHFIVDVIISVVVVNDDVGVSIRDLTNGLAYDEVY